MKNPSEPLISVPQPPYVVEHPDGHLRPSPDHEWVIANGNGGFAMGTASGVNRRKYHALLIASTNPPVDRVSCLTGLDEVISIKDASGKESSRIHLSTHRFVGGRLAPNGTANLIRFEKTATIAKWVYECSGVRITKELKLGWRRNVCAVRYSVRSGDGAGMVHFSITPRVMLRDFHGTLRENDPGLYRITCAGSEMTIEREGKSLTIACDRGTAVDQPSVLPRVLLDMESERHQEDEETLFTPGSIEVELMGGESSFVVSAALAPEKPDLKLFTDESREKHLASVRARYVKSNAAREPLGPLVDAADDFLVPRKVDGKQLMTVLAGFPWFADWGRDTMISLFGLMLTTERYEDARGCLETFARYVKDGMIPNLFDDYGGPPQYNTVDASLWFLHACRAYAKASGDSATYRSLLLPACEEIIAKYQSGTHFDIRMDDADGLIAAGDHTTQLTWMDAKRNGVVFTPRHGKAVEINALWIHGLVCTAEGLEEAGRKDDAAALRALAARAGEWFRRLYWNDAEQRLNDCLQRDGMGTWRPVPEIRPNQIFAASLEHSPLTMDQRAAVVANVKKHLLTGEGLRTLSPTDRNYCARFEGDMMVRDRAYHNGTVWPWLIGAYCEAVLRAGSFSADSKAEVRRVLQPLIDSLREGCLGQIAEVYDAEDVPTKRRPQGCIAQAWSVAEVLRAATLAAE